MDKNIWGKEPQGKFLRIEFPSGSYWGFGGNPGDSRVLTCDCCKRPITELKPFGQFLRKRDRRIYPLGKNNVARGNGWVDGLTDLQKICHTNEEYMIKAFELADDLRRTYGIKLDIWLYDIFTPLDDVDPYYECPDCFSLPDFVSRKISAERDLKIKELFYAASGKSRSELEDQIIGYEDGVPIILCDLIDDGKYSCLIFYCPECNECHIHCLGEGRRHPLCTQGAFLEKGYILRIKRREGGKDGHKRVHTLAAGRRFNLPPS